MRIPLGLSVGERLSFEETLEHARFCDERGFESIWVAEGRLTRDGIAPFALIAHETERIKVGTGVINSRTRNASTMAVTFKTLNEIAPERVILGLGAWWEPLASSVGLPLRKPVKQMREYVTVIKRFFANEEVVFDGEFVQMNGARFDMMYRENKPVPVPIYLGAVREKMLTLAGEITEGVLLDFLLPPEYNGWALEQIQKGIDKRDDGVERIDTPQLVACSVDDKNPQQAIDACKRFLTMYLAQQPHIGELSGIDPDLLRRIGEEMTWPSTPEKVAHTSRLLSNELVQERTACGTVDDALGQIQRYLDAGATCAVLCTLGDTGSTTRAIAEAAA